MSLQVKEKDILSIINAIKHMFDSGGRRNKKLIALMTTAVHETKMVWQFGKSYNYDTDKAMK